MPDELVVYGASDQAWRKTVGGGKHEVKTTSGTPPAFAVLSIGVVPRGTQIGTGPGKTRWDSLVELRREGANVVAISFAVSEYGIGVTEEAAEADLLTSLADYLSWLQKRKGGLAPSERNDLAKLEELLEQ